MESKVLDELMAELSRSMHLNRIVLGTMWQWIQKKEADKTPDDWQPYTVFVPPTGAGAGPQAQALQVVGHNVNRGGLAILNNGPAAVALCSRSQDINEALTLDVNETTVGTFPFILLPSGQSTIIGTRGAVYAISMSATQAAGLSVVETVYSTQTGGVPNPSVPIGHAALLEKGLPLDADHSDLQRTMT